MATQESTALALPTQEPVGYLEKLFNGDLSSLTTAERKDYYIERCTRIGLDPMSQPFLFLELPERKKVPGTRDEWVTSNKVILYPTRSATDQIAKRDGLSGTITGKEVLNSILIVTVAVTDGTRTTENIGVCEVPSFPSQLANAFKRAVTQAYRRAVIQHSGLGMISEDDIADVAGARELGMHGVSIEPAAQQALARQQAPRQLRAAPAAASKPAPKTVTNRDTGEVVTPPTAEQLQRMAQLRQELHLWWGVTARPGVPKSAAKAAEWLQWADGQTNAPVLDANTPATPEQLALMERLRSEITALGGTPEAIASEVTRSSAYVQYLRLIEDLAVLQKMHGPQPDLGVIDQDQQDAEDLPF